MNKITKGLCMMAVVALAFSSCKKQENTKTDSVVFNHTTEQMVTVNDENEFEKVYFDPQNVIAYEVGDQLMLFDIREGGNGSRAAAYELVTENDQTLLTTVAGQTALDATTTGAYYAFYPATNVRNVTSLTNGNRATFQLSTTQTYRPNDGTNTMLPKGALYIAAKAEESTLNDAMFICRNICGVLKLNFYSPSGKQIQSIEVTDNKFNIVGDVELKIDEVDPDYMSDLFGRYSDDATYQTELSNYLQRLGYNTSNATNKVTLDCGNGVQIGATKAAATPFYIVMRPLALLKGCSIKVNFVGGGSKVINSTKNNVIKPNMIRNMAATSVG